MIEGNNIGFETGEHQLCSGFQFLTLGLLSLLYYYDNNGCQHA